MLSAVNPLCELPRSLSPQIYQLLKMDCYMRFKRSDLVKECLLADMEGNPLPIGPAPQIVKNPWKKQKVSARTHKQTHTLITIIMCTLSVNSIACITVTYTTCITNYMYY